MSHKQIEIYNAPYRLFNRPLADEFTAAETEALQGKFLRSTRDSQAVGKVVGQYGSRDAAGVRYFLIVTWNKRPPGYPTKERTSVFKHQLGSTMELQTGGQVLVAMQEWLQRGMSL